MASIGDKKWTVRTLDIKRGDSGCGLRGKIRTAAWLLIELRKEARR